jgi:peptide/nickel transport system substrate-binding protein
MDEIISKLVPASDSRSSPLEELKFAEAAVSTTQKAIALDMQKLLFEEAPYVPLGYYAGPTIYRTSVTDIRDGFPQMYGVKRI